MSAARLQASLANGFAISRSFLLRGLAAAINYAYANCKICKVRIYFNCSNKGDDFNELFH